MKRLTIQGRPVSVYQKNIRNMYLYVYPQDGTVKVTAPLMASEQEIVGFVAQKQDWIAKKLNAGARAAEPVPDYLTGEEVRLWGNRLLLEVRETAARPGVALEEYRLVLLVPKGAGRDGRRDVLLRWYREELHRRIGERREHWQQVTGVSAREWRIKNMKTKWGTCNVRDRRIWLNLQLVQYPPRCLDYVMAHELAHLIEPSHNAVFKAAMNRFMPDWQAVKKELNTKDEPDCKV